MMDPVAGCIDFRLSFKPYGIAFFLYLFLKTYNPGRISLLHESIFIINQAIELRIFDIRIWGDGLAFILAFKDSCFEMKGIIHFGIA